MNTIADGVVNEVAVPGGGDSSARMSLLRKIHQFVNSFGSRFFRCRHSCRHGSRKAMKVGKASK